MIDSSYNSLVEALSQDEAIEVPYSMIRTVAQAEDGHELEATASESTGAAGDGAVGDAHDITANGAEDAHDEHTEATDGHGGQVDHGGGHSQETLPARVPDELPNVYSLYAAWSSGRGEHGEGHGGGEHHAPWWVNPAFSTFYAVFFLVLIWKVIRNLSVDKPSKPQVAIESLFGGLAEFFGEIVGPENTRKFVPFIGTLWLFILLNNWFALVPLFKSPTAHFQTTIGLALCTFMFVNYHGIKEGGIQHYFWHLCGSPTDVVGWALSPLMLVLETISTFIKPLSLALRLYGNIFGEDKLLAIFLGLGFLLSGVILGTPAPLVGIPLHLPFLFLSLMLGGIQATVFAMLSAVYIALLLPHDDHDHEGEHAEAH